MKMVLEVQALNHKNPLWIFRMPKKLHPASKDAGFRFFVHNKLKRCKNASKLQDNAEKQKIR
jgi:uncharacterized protein YicC (UPF0701 family)